MFQVIIFVFLAFTTVLISQDFTWPLKTGRYLTAVFGEERPGRYHTGIDIRTFGEIGYELVAVGDGYLSRIRTSSKGYGKTFYLKLKDGNTAVYAHLDHFTPQLDNLVSALHTHYGKYTIDHKLNKNEYQFKKGDIIGYSGDTGGVSGPHLHFELRNEEGQPLNPFNKGFIIFDDIPPIAKSIALIPLNAEATIQGNHFPRVYPLKRLDANNYYLEEIIHVQGEIGFAVDIYDRISKQPFNFGIYSLDLMIDARFIYSVQYDIIDWENADQIYTERSYLLAREGYGKFYHLFSHHDSHQLPFVNHKSQKGLNFSNSGLHDAVIKVRDYAGNTIEITANFSSDTLPDFNYFTQFSKNNLIVSFNEEQDFYPQFFLSGAYKGDRTVPADIFDIGDNSYLVENVKPPLDVVEVAALDLNGVSSYPTFHFNPKKPSDEIYGKLKIKHYEYGVIITFEESEFTGLTASLTIEKDNLLMQLPLERSTKLTHSSPVFTPSEMAELDELKIHYNDLSPNEVFKMSLSGGLAYPDSSFNFNLLDGLVKIAGSPHSFFDTTYVWAEYSNIPGPENGEIIVGPVTIKPDLFPFNNELQFKISVEDAISINHLGIFYYDRKNDDWIYMPTELSDDGKFLQTDILSGEIFAVIEETTPPNLTNLIPDINGTYYSGDLEHLTLYISDIYPGIDGENDVEILVDGKNIVFEYNSYQKKIRYPFKTNLSRGTHKIFIQAKDYLGNRTKVEGEFFVK